MSYSNVVRATNVRLAVKRGTVRPKCEMEEERFPNESRMDFVLLLPSIAPQSAIDQGACLMSAAISMGI